MKKTLKILAFSLFSIAGLTVVSCDNESYDPIIEGEKGVGKPVVTVNNQGEVFISREDVVATVDKNGVVEIIMKNVDKSGKDYLLLRTLKFDKGTYPTNANKCEYYSAEHDLFYTTYDPDRPTLVTGTVKINEINKKARVLSGDFDIKRMMPPAKNDNPNLKAFPITGNFKDIPYKRKEVQYLEALVNGVALSNPKEKGEYKGDRIVVSSLDDIEKTEELIIDFPNNSEELVASSDPKDFKKLGWFKVAYTSPYGVKYTSNEVAASEGLLRFDMAELDKDDKSKYWLKGRFEATLIRVDNPEEKIKVTYGDFSIALIKAVK